MKLNANDIDIITELINIGMGRAANLLNQMLSAHIELRVPTVYVLESEAALEELWQRENLPTELAAVWSRFSRDFNGRTALLFPPESAAKLVALVSGEAYEHQSYAMDDLRIGVLTEIGNIVLNSLMSTISNLLGSNLRFSFPAYQEGPRQQVLTGPGPETPMSRLLANAVFSIQAHHITGHLYIILETTSLKKLITQIGEGGAYTA